MIQVAVPLLNFSAMKEPPAGLTAQAGTEPNSRNRENISEKIPRLLFM
jgi:hypothetical protein